MIGRNPRLGSVFSILNTAGSLMQGSHAKQSPNQLNSHENKMMGSSKGDYDVNQSLAISVALNVEAPEFPFSSNLQFNIFAKVFMLQTDVMCRDTCYYADNAGRLHKYVIGKQSAKALQSFSGKL